MTATSQSTAPMCNLPAIVEAMMRPEMYPDHPRSVEVRQTHVSYAFMAGDYVYKIKKPVRFAFLDACTLARRHQLCLDEVRLNRRLAPDVYLGVVPILRRGGRVRAGRGVQRRGRDGRGGGVGGQDAPAWGGHDARSDGGRGPRERCADSCDRRSARRLSSRGRRRPGMEVRRGGVDMAAGAGKRRRTRARLRGRDRAGRAG